MWYVEMFERSSNFDGTFKPLCEESCVPQSLMALVSMILEGPNINEQRCQGTAKVRVAVILTVLFMFNSENVKSVQSLEPYLNLSIYSVKLHADTRRETL